MLREDAIAGQLLVDKIDQIENIEFLFTEPTPETVTIDDITNLFNAIKDIQGSEFKDSRIQTELEAASKSYYDDMKARLAALQTTIEGELTALASE